jgi:hypothetical protein
MNEIATTLPTAFAISLTHMGSALCQTQESFESPSELQ